MGKENEPAPAKGRKQSSSRKKARATDAGAEHAATPVSSVAPGEPQTLPGTESTPVSVAETPSPGTIRTQQVRGAQSNALGTLIERQFVAPGSPCRSYSDLERRSGISREALSRYVTSRADRRRSPTVDTLVAISGALHLPIEALSRAASLATQARPLPEESQMSSRQETLRPFIEALTSEQFSAVVEIVRLMNRSEESD